MVEKLKTLDLFDKQEFLEKYIDLIKSNLNNQPIKGQTQSHHIIPRGYYKILGIEVDNSKENLINLKYSDHILAHWYLYKASKKGPFKNSNLYALFYMLNTLDVPEDEGILKLNILNYGEIYSNFCLMQAERTKSLNIGQKLAGRKDSKETRLRKSLAHKGIIPNEQARKNMGEAQKKAWEDPKRKEKCSRPRKITSEKLKGRTPIYNPITEEGRLVYIDELDTYLSDGWVRGRSPSFGVKIRDSIKGREVSEETKLKMSKAHKGKSNPWVSTRFLGSHYKYMSNGVIAVKVFSLDEEKQYLNQGFEYGTLKQVKERNGVFEPPKAKSNKGYKGIHKGNVYKTVSKEDLPNYLNDGWDLGMPKRK